MDIQEQIDQVRIQQNSIIKAKTYLKDLETRIIWERQKITKIELNLKLKFEDLEKLQNLKTNRLFSQVLVSKEIQLEDKRQEYLEKFLQFKEAKKSLDFLIYEKKIILDKIKTGKGLDEKLKMLLVLKEENLIKNHPESSKVIIDLQVSIDKCNLMSREIYEALIEGKRTKRHIATITTNLNQAKILRRFTFVNENEKVYTDEKAHVDKAMEAVYILKPILRKFELELEDIYKKHGYQLEMSLDSLSGFTKKYYNYLINDWIIYEKINVAAKTMNELESTILHIIKDLEEEDLGNKQSIKNLQKEKQYLLDLI